MVARDEVDSAGQEKSPDRDATADRYRFPAAGLFYLCDVVDGCPQRVAG